MMEVSAGSFHSHEKQPFEGSTPANEAKKPVETNLKTPIFVNHAANAWHENRKKWIGDLRQGPKTIEKDPIIRGDNNPNMEEMLLACDYNDSWSMTYEDLLSTNDPFPESIPLTEMVDFLVDIWLDEGLFD